MSPEKKFNEYFTIDQNFKPCMSKAGINETPDYWMNFYPHESFVNFLQMVINSLSGDEQTVWLAAPYGTGKSHAVLVLQKLLSDDASRVKQWLDRFKTEIPESVCAALWNLREQNPLAVYDCGSDAITKPSQFLVRLQQSIISALKEKNCSIPVMGQLDKLLERCREEGENFFKTRDSIQDELAYLNPDIKNIDDLEKQIAKPLLTSRIVNDIMIVFEKRGIYLNLSVDNFLDWVKEIVKANNLSKILFIWDEFSTYVDQNRSQLTTFQEVANAAREGKFYLLPVTHMKLESYVAAGSESAKKVNGRFNFCSLEMPTNTALSLAALVFKIIPGQEKTWDYEKEKLWKSVKPVVEDYMAEIDEDCQSDPDKFKGVMPIHPMAAYMLKFLATMVGSNQRSMFSFLKGDLSHTEFQDFMAQGGPYEVGKQFLTVDYLWSYFVERDDLGLGVEINKIRMEFNRKSKLLEPNEIRVFKAVLLYSLLDSLTGSSGNKLIEPSIENIENCFKGDGGIVNIPEYIKQLEKKHCLSIVNDLCVTFREESNSDDVEKIKLQILSDFKGSICDEDQKSDEIRLSKALENKIKQTNKDKFHFAVRCSTPDKVHLTCQNHKEDFGPDKNKVLVQFIVAPNAEEQNLVAEKAKALADLHKDFRMLFIVTPEIHFCTFNENNWEEYADQRAHASLANDTASSEAYNKQASKIFDDWKQRYFESTQRLQIYKASPDGEVSVIDRTWETLNPWLQSYLRSCFECFLDDLSEYNTNAISERLVGLAGWAKAGLLKDGIGPHKSVLKSLSNKNIAATTEWFESHPESPLTKLRDFCKKKLDNALDGSGNCSIRKILDDLVKPPFGLLYVPFTAFILGVAMNEWLNNSKRVLQWTDKIQSNPLDADTLAEMIGSAVEDRGKNAIKNEKFVCRISREEKAFIDAAPDMFGIDHEPKASVITVLQKISTRLQQITDKVPLWILKDYVPKHEEPFIAGVIVEILDKLGQALSISSKSDPKNNKTALIKSVGTLIRENEGISQRIRRYIDPEIFDKAFKEYIDKVKPELQSLAQETGDCSSQYCQSIKCRCAETSSWLWSPQDINNELDATLAQYKIIQTVQGFIDQSAFISFDSAMDRLKKAFFVDNKISFAVLAGDYPVVTELQKLMDNSGVSDGISQFAQSLKTYDQQVKKLFFDPTFAVQIGTLKRIFAPQLESLGEEDVRAIYQKMSPNALLQEDAFRQVTSQTIDEYLKESVATSLIAMWREKTNSSNPASWSVEHRLPVSVLFDTQEEAAEMVHILQDPSAYQSDRLKTALARLSDLSFTSNEEELQNKFLKQALPTKYQQLNINVSDLKDFLSESISSNPNVWMMNHNELSDKIDLFIHNSYQKNYCDQAVSVAKGFEASEAKDLLVELVKQYPDVGLKILEGKK